jgi:hypothetical protein
MIFVSVVCSIIQARPFRYDMLQANPGKWCREVCVRYLSVEMQLVNTSMVMVVVQCEISS